MVVEPLKRLEGVAKRKTYLLAHSKSKEITMEKPKNIKLILIDQLEELFIRAFLRGIVTKCILSGSDQLFLKL